MTKWHLRALLGAGLLALVTGGCPQPATIEIPDELAVVLNAPATYRAPEADPLRGIEQDEVRDLLTELGGCWGGVQPDEDPNNPVALYTVWHFDRSSGEYTNWSAFGNVDGGLSDVFPFVAVETGRYQIVTASQIEFTVTEIRTNFDPSTGAVRNSLQPLTLDEEEVVRTISLTLEGDQLVVFVDETGSDLVSSERDRVILQSFACP